MNVRFGILLACLAATLAYCCGCARLCLYASRSPEVYLCVGSGSTNVTVNLYYNSDGGGVFGLGTLDTNLVKAAAAGIAVAAKSGL